jgi:hypothetical protein
MQLTDIEIRLLTALKAAHESRDKTARSHMWAMGNWWTPGDLKRCRMVDQDITDRWLHRELVKLSDQRGLVARKKIAGQRHYQINTAGRAALEDVYKRETI